MRTRNPSARGTELTFSVKRQLIGELATLMAKRRISVYKTGFLFCSETLLYRFTFPRDSKLSSIGVFMIYERQKLHNDSVGFVIAARLIFG